MNILLLACILAPLLHGLQNHISKYWFPLFIYFGYHLFNPGQNRFNAFPPRTETEAHKAREVRNRLATMSELCLQAYEQPRHDQTYVRIDGWSYVDHCDGGTFWLYKKSDAWALVVRGTQHLHELAGDWRLFVDSVRGGAGYAEDARRTLELATGFLHRHGVLGNLTITGHSIGSNRAGFLLAALGPVLPNCSAVTFDCPGQPEGFRQLNGMGGTLDRHEMLNARPNLVNTLGRPCVSEGNFYCCGKGSNIPLRDFIAPLMLLSHFLPGSFLTSACRTFYLNTAQHQLESIRRHILEGNYHRSSPASWPTHSLKFARMVYRRLGGSRRAVQSPSIDLAMRHVVAARFGSAPRPLAPLLPVFPLELAQFTLSQPYRIDNPRDEWDRLFGLLAPGDKIFALCGVTNAGKTSSLKALLGHAREDLRLVIRTGANCTIVPSITWVRTVAGSKIFIMDVPGGGAEHQASVQNEWIMNSGSALVERLADRVGAIFFVQREAAIVDEAFDYYSELRACAERHQVALKVLYNSDRNPGPLREDAIGSIAAAFGIPGDTIVTYSAVTEAGLTEEDYRRGDVQPLLGMWETQLLATSLNLVGGVGEMSQTNQAVRAQESAGHAASSMRPRFSRLRDTVCGTVAFVTTTTATTLPGMAWWGTISGPILCTITIATPTVIVATVPTAIVLGSTVGQHYFRRWWFAPRSTAQQD